MPNIVSWLPKADYKELEKQCDILNETIYEYTQKAVRLRLRQNETLAEKANRWLWGLPSSKSRSERGTTETADPQPPK